MTNEDKKIVVDYMNWPASGNDMRHEMFDLNDAGLVVAEMQKRSEWESFEIYCFKKQRAVGAQYIAWMLNAENFFKSFVSWRKQR
jgi:hypothetical protein